MQVFDEDGNDVTPAPLIHPDGGGGVPKGPSKGSIAGDESQVGVIGLLLFRAVHKLLWLFHKTN